MATVSNCKLCAGFEPDTPHMITSFNKRLRGKTTVTPVITPEVRTKLAEAIALYGLGGQGNPERENFSTSGPISHCTVCGAARHSVKWVVRLSGQGQQKTSGGQCYCCNRASSLLGCSRGLYMKRF